MIGLIDVDSKIPNLALMKISSYYKSLGEEVEFVQADKEYEKIYASAIFTKSKNTCEGLINTYGDRIEIGGTGWDIKKELPAEIEKMKPDYDLYTVDLLYPKMGGISTREHRLKKAKQLYRRWNRFYFKRLHQKLRILFCSGKGRCFSRCS